MDLQKESRKTLKRIIDSIEQPKMTKKEQSTLMARLDAHFPALFEKLHQLYGGQYDFYFHLQQLITTLIQGYASRSRKLKQKDASRLLQPDWYRDEKMLGMACYVDLFAGDLKKLKDKIPYLKSLGITYLHLMPLYKAPEGDSDGGYAVSDYRKVDPSLGTEKDLVTLAQTLAEEGISLVLDFVFNHTSDEHAWAQAARRGDEEFENYYYLFDNKQEVDEYNAHLREIFPQVRRGSFTHQDDINKWVWTTFNSFQWDLNYANPAVFNAITDEMLFLANIGCEGLRLDALAFIWKEKGTRCESLPKAHTLIQAFNQCLQIVAPAVVFKSEAIVHPDEVAQYIDAKECQLSYNPLLMALMWESLATRETKLLTASLQKSFAISDQCAWVNYIRCHDDIGWTFDDAVAGQLGINGFDHRRFLNQFYTGRFEGSFAKGVAFQENPTTGDCRVCGSLASLAGLESAIEQDNSVNIEHAIGRILLLNSINLSIGGIPLLYAGDELAILNDHSYLSDESKKEDSRWVNRPLISDSDIEKALQPATPQFAIRQGVESMIQIRKEQEVFGAAATEILQTGNPHLFAYARIHANGQKMLAMCNFSEHELTADASITGILQTESMKDLLSGKPLSAGEEINLAAYQVLWLIAD